MTDFILYAYTFRSRAARVHWALNEFGFSCKVIRLDPFKGETRTDAFRKLNPASKVPVLVHGDKVMTESIAIMEYLNDISPDKKLAPTDPDAAYDYRKVLLYGLTELEPYMWLSEQSRRLRRLYTWPSGTYKQAMVRSEQGLEPVWHWLKDRKYVAGDDFTLADIYYYHLITWAKQNGIDYPEHVLPYLEMLQSRPAFPKDMRPD